MSKIWISGRDFRSDFPPRNDPCRDESKWRASTIPATRKIKMTDAHAKYHLKPINLAGLNYEEQQYHIPRKTFMGTRRLYRELDVERAAWVMYGSPEHFERFLPEGRDQVKNFRYPAHYA